MRGGSYGHGSGLRRLTALGDQTQEIAGHDQVFIARVEVESPNFREFNSRMQPWAIGTEENLSWTGSLQGLFQKIEAPHTGGLVARERRWDMLGMKS